MIFTPKSFFSFAILRSPFLLPSFERGAVGLCAHFAFPWSGINEVCVITKTKYKWPKFTDKVSITTLGACKDGLAYKDKVISLVNCFEVTSPGIKNVCLWRRSDNVNWICSEVSPLRCHSLMFILEIKSCFWWAYAWFNCFSLLHK